MERLSVIAFTAVIMTACSLDNAPDYEAVPEINGISCTPALDNVTVNDEVSVQADITNEKGEAYACLLYRTGNDLVSACAGELKRTETITIPNGSGNFHFSATIPRQPEGKYVVFSVCCLNAYGAEALSDRFAYEVLSADGNTEAANAGTYDVRAEGAYASEKAKDIENTAVSE